jgi:transcription elongation factor GreA
MVKRVPMTVNGEFLLQSELHDLKTVQRPKIILDIAEAREHGDLKENAEYHAAKEKQSFVEGRIKDIEGKLSCVQVIDIKNITAKDRIIFGCTVQLYDTTNNKRVTYKIVGEDEADIKKQKISFISPLARKLIGKNKNDVISIKSLDTTITYTIVSIMYC